MFKKHIKNILQGELDNKAVHLLFPKIKKATIHVACTYLKLVHHKIVFSYSPCSTNKKIMCTLKTVSKKLVTENF